MTESANAITFGFPKLCLVSTSTRTLLPPPQVFETFDENFDQPALATDVPKHIEELTNGGNSGQNSTSPCSLPTPSEHSPSAAWFAS